METLNLRWEELGVKEAQLKAHIQKFEQFIQVSGCAAYSRPWTPTLSSSPPCLPLLFLLALAHPHGGLDVS